MLPDAHSSEHPASIPTTRTLLRRCGTLAMARARRFSAGAIILAQQNAFGGQRETGRTRGAIFTGPSWVLVRDPQTSSYF
eukprot:4742725-Prymnesium_polylepis.1